MEAENRNRIGVKVEPECQLVSYEQLDFTGIEEDDGEEYNGQMEDPLSVSVPEEASSYQNRHHEYAGRQAVEASLVRRIDIHGLSESGSVWGVGNETKPKIEDIDGVLKQVKADADCLLVKDDATESIDSLEDEVVRRLKNHMPKVGDGNIKRVRPCLCSICNLGFPTQALFLAHLNKEHSDVRKYPCGHCGKRFFTLRQMRIHESIHDEKRFLGEPKYACDLCDKKFHIKGTLASHRKYSHLGFVRPKPKRASVPNKYHRGVGVRRPEPEVKVELVLHPCSQCDLKFKMKCQLKKHMRSHTKETPYQCPICQQPLQYSSSLVGHMRNRHGGQTKGPRPARPKFMHGQPCPCTICGKFFKIPSQLKRHMRLHTGEKPFECDICGQRFRLSDGMRRHRLRHQFREKNITNRFKCLICGRHNFLMFSEFRNHRMSAHRHIPFEKNTEKPFGCGICGKPFYLHEQAMVCAILGHDPTSLRIAMFKHKCPECPEQSFGYHNLLTLRKHWSKEHSDKSLPVELRAGMYQNVKDSLPKVVISKEKAQEIQENGPGVKYDFPLVIEFDLLTFDQKLFPLPAKKSGRKKGPTDVQCPDCGLSLKSKNLKRHIMQLHSSSKASSNLRCEICGKTFQRIQGLRQHEKWHRKQIKRKPGRPRKTLLSENPSLKQPYTDNINGPPKRRPGRPRKRPPTLDNCSKFTECTVSIYDTGKIRAILGNKTLKVILFKIAVVV